MGEVTMVRRRIPEPEQIRMPKPEKMVFITERLTDQARSFLRARGFSNRFINALGFMLREAGNKNRSTDMRPQRDEEREENQPGRQLWTNPAVDMPHYGHMPSDISGFVAYSEWHGRQIIMPDIGVYAPTITYSPTVYRAFASAEGQRFMNRYYVTGWMRRSPSGEWTIRPPASAASVAPRRRE